MNGVIHTSKVKACKVGHIYSVTKNAAVNNGEIGYVGELKAGETEIREFLQPTAELIKNGELVVIATPELMYDVSRKADGALGNFINEADSAMVAIPLAKGDEIEISENIIDGSVQVGHYLIAQTTSHRLKVSATIPEGTKFAAKINYTKVSGVAAYTGAKAGNVYNLVHVTVVSA